MEVVQKNGKIYLDDPNQKLSYITVTPPEHFSIINNTEKTVDFFNEVITIFNAENFEGLFLFNLENITNITIDAIMYMNALSINRLSRNTQPLKIMLKWPKKKKIKTFLKRSGLNKYLKNKKNDISQASDYYAITGGKKTDVNRIREIGLFTCEKLRIEIKDLDFISSTFVELMNNTEQHAYDKKKDKLWYVFIEDTSVSVKYTFLDTGKGIPETVRKSYQDNFNDFISIMDNNQSYFIFEALKGEISRSSSEIANRNTGLPEIYRFYKEERLSKLKIISGKGVCTFYDSDRKKPNLVNLNNNFCGTLFTWEVKK